MKWYEVLGTKAVRDFGEDELMRPMVSIIVPIYNAEQYLRRCVDSILNQEYTDYELLLVNDGSTDASGDICEEYGDRSARNTATRTQESL